MVLTVIKNVSEAPMHELRTPGGWNILGYHRAELGLGEAGRRIANAVLGTGYPFELVGSHTPFAPQDEQLRHRVTERVTFRHSMVAINADQAINEMWEAGVLDDRDGLRVGVWFWELSSFPERFAHVFDEFDEIWAASDFMRDAFATVSPIPVRRFTLEIPVRPHHSVLQRRDVELDERFTFLVKFDWQSVVGRKNPYDAIESYRRAFPDGSQTRLLIRTVNAASDRARFEELVERCGDRSDITVVDGWLSAGDARAQMELADCFVSLHRAEGFGLNVANAMACATPVIATAYSGNLDFMDSESSWLVPYELTRVGELNAPYDPDALWAQPNVDVATQMMRDVAANQDEAHRRAQRARERIRETHSRQVASRSILSLLNALIERTSS